MHDFKQTYHGVYVILGMYFGAGCEIAVAKVRLRKCVTLQGHRKVHVYVSHDTYTSLTTPLVIIQPSEKLQIHSLLVLINRTIDLRTHSHSHNV